MFPEKEKEVLESSNKKETQSEKGNEGQVSNQNIIVDISEVFNSSVKTEKRPSDKTLSINGNTPTSDCIYRQFYTDYL